MTPEQAVLRLGESAKHKDVRAEFGDVPKSLYFRLLREQGFGSAEEGHADVAKAHKVFIAWLERLDKRRKKPGWEPTSEGDRAWEPISIALRGWPTPAEDEGEITHRTPIASGGGVDAQGLFDPVLIEKLSRADLGGADKAAEKFAKVADAITKMAIAKQKKRLEDEKSAALASVPAAMKMTEGYARHVVRGLETFAAQHVDRLAVETELPKETIRKVLAAAQPHWRTIHEDGIDLVRARRDELRAEAEAKAAKSGWR